MDRGDNQNNMDKKIAGRLGANHFIASNSGFLNSFEGVSQVPGYSPRRRRCSNAVVEYPGRKGRVKTLPPQTRTSARPTISLN